MCIRDRSILVAALHRRIAAVLDIAPVTFRLMISGKDISIEGWRTLREYDIQLAAAHGVIDMAVRMAGGAPRGGVKKVNEKKKAKKQKKEDKDSESDANSDQDDEPQGKSKNAVIAKMAKECENMLADIEREVCFQQDDHLNVMVNMMRDKIKLIKDGDGDDKLKELLAGLPEKKLHELSSSNVTAQRNMGHISKTVSNAIFEQEGKILKSKVEAAWMMQKVLGLMPQLLYAAKFCNSNGRFDHGNFETMLVKLVSDAARTNARPSVTVQPLSRLGSLLGQWV